MDPKKSIPFSPKPISELYTNLVETSMGVRRYKRRNDKGKKVKGKG
jgi:hypothetical protein